MDIEYYALIVRTMKNPCVHLTSSIVANSRNLSPINNELQ
jgi:hypothetical protein